MNLQYVQVKAAIFTSLGPYYPHCDLNTLQWPTVHLLLQIPVSATCLCVSPVIRAVWWPPIPALTLHPPAKAPRGPDHGEANMWFELTSQKQAIHTWGCLRSPTARCSPCVLSNCECVCAELIVFVCTHLCDCMPVSCNVCVVLILQQEIRVN